MLPAKTGMARASTEQRAAERLRELTVVYELLHTLTSTLELPEVLRIVLARIKSLTRAEAISLLLYDEERDELVFAATETLQENSLLGLRVPVAQSIAGWAARNGKTVIVNGVRNDPRFCDSVDRASGFTTRDVVVVPLRKDGRVIGALELANRYDGRPYEEADANRLASIAEEVVKAIDTEDVERNAAPTRDLLERAVGEVPSEAAGLLLLAKGGRELAFQASRTLRPGVVDGLRMPTGRGIAGWVARHRQSLKLDDVANDPRHERKIGEQASLVARTMICVPMVSKDRLRGVIQVINKVGGEPFDDDELRLTERLAEHAAIAIENASLYRQAYLASITDDLTGLGNTRRFHQVLAEAIGGGGEVSLIVLDLDHFKEVVDRYGHLVGSRTIADFGRRIGKRLRPGDFAARFGGDEFVVLLPATGAEEARAIADAIRGEIEACTRLEDEDVDLSAVTASAGVAVHPTHATDSSGLFRAADAAMYRAKNGGRNRVVVAGDAA